jgi:hypothetical protein
LLLPFEVTQKLPFGGCSPPPPPPVVPCATP